MEKMTAFFNFDEIFGDFREIMKRLQEFDELETEFKSEKLKGGWNVQQIDEPNVKGYVIQGRFWSDQPFEPFDPFQPRNPFERRPMPRRFFGTPTTASKGAREPLMDLFEEDKEVKIYVELPGEEKDDIQLNVTKGRVEVKTKNFYKMINVPWNVDSEKASSQYHNGVLTITVPKDEKTSENEKRKIQID